MSSYSRLTVFLTLAASSLVQADFNGVTTQERMEELEHIMVDNGGFNSDGAFGAITPCSVYSFPGGSSQDQGEQTTAEWIRVIFHDFVTGDVSSGVGGMDASIGFETARAENVGLFINDTINFFRPNLNAYASMADLLSLGLVMSVATCGGTDSQIPLRAGRIDATEAGPSGVPTPEMNIEDTLAAFSKAGFNQSDTITVTTCGHSVGRVHYSNFPDIVPESSVTSNDTDGGVPFDSTPGEFDNAVVVEYINGNGSLGGPLVTSSNETERSDYRLYSSDSNATMKGLVSESTFQSECNRVFSKMIDVVPSTVQLSDIVTPLTFKAVNVKYDLSSEGTVTVSGLIRNLIATTDTFPTTLDYTTSCDTATLTTDVQSENGTSQYGQTAYFPFNTTISTQTCPSTATLSTSSNTLATLNPYIFVLSPSSNTTTTGITLRAAALTSLAGDGDMSAIFYVPTAQTGSVAEAVTNTTVTMTSVGTVGNYTIYESSVTASSAGTIVVKVVQGSASSVNVKSTIFG